MKLSYALTLTAALLLAASWTPAMSSHPAGSNQRLLPVLVNVNTKGEVTDISPAYKVRPGFNHALRETLKKMVTKPAMVKGKPVRSQFVATFALIPTTSADGKSTVTLKYLKSQALPPDTWYWVHRKPPNDQLALANQHAQIMSPYSRFPGPSFQQEFGPAPIARSQGNNSGGGGGKK